MLADPRSAFRALALLSVAAVAAVGCSGGDDAPGTRARETTTKATAPTAPTVAAGSLRGDRLVSALRRGGYVLYFRHAATDAVPDDADPVVLSNCDTQRNLSARGRGQARAIGSAIERLEIPIGHVLASPFCRALETARLAFGRATRAPVLENLETVEDEEERRGRVDGLGRLLSTAPEAGANRVLVGHGFNITAAADVTLAEGEAAIFRPEPPRDFALVATVTRGEWEDLAGRLGAGRRAVVREYRVPAGSAPHDVAPASRGRVWYTAQGAGELGRLDPATGKVERVSLGEGSAPHGVIVGPDGAAWVTDGGLNAIVRVDGNTLAVRRFPLPGDAYSNLNTATFDRRGVLWFTGQSGYYGRLDPASGRVDVFEAPRGEGPYGITTTPRGDVYYASLAGSHIARINTSTGRASVLEPPTEGQGARRIWSDSRGRLWISEWNAGKLGMYDPAGDSWREWRLPGPNPQPYAVYVDERDQVWLSDFGANALVRFDPDTERFTRFSLPSEPADVRQLLGRPGEVWGAESAADALVVVRTGGGE
jgi:virginiamycin B lyase